MRAVGIFLVSCFFAHVLVAQMANIHGTVTDINGNALVGVSVKIQDSLVLSNNRGEYSIIKVPYGSYVLSFSKEGMVSVQQVLLANTEFVSIKTTMISAEKDLTEVKIIATRSANETSVEIGKIPIRPFDLPQAVATIDQTVIENQQAQQLSDVLKNANGVYIMGNTGGYQEEISGRGFAFGSNNTFKNGVRFNNSIMPEVGSLEKMELLKGGAAILFGNVAAGGVMNLVTKKPKFQKGGELSMRMSSYDFYKPSIDVYGGLNKKQTIAYRVNSSYQTSKSFRDVVSAERFYINPSLVFLVGKKMQILLEGDYLSDNRTADFGVGAINYTLIDVPRSNFLGTTWSYMKTNQKSVTSTITYQLNSKWQLKHVSSFQAFNNDLFSTVRPNSASKFIAADGTWIRGIQRNQVDEQYMLTQLDITGKFATGKVKHTLLFGAEFDQYATNTLSFNSLSNYDTINVFNINVDNQRSDIPTLTEKTMTQTPQKRAGIYVQDLICLSNKVKLLLGVRYSYLETNSNVFTYSNQLTTYSKIYSNAISPRVGIVYQPIKTMSLFASYSNSFTPNTGVDVNGNALTPSIIDQYEAGVKNDFFRGKLSLNVTVYQIVNSNVAQMVLENGNTNANIKELAGEITSKGLEIDLTAKPFQGFSVIAGYSLNETKYTKSTIYGAGALLLYQPRNTANTSLSYEIQNHRTFKGLNFGLSGLYFGKRFAGRLTRLNVPNDTYRPIALPEYISLDAMIGYNHDNFSVRLKISNIFNALSYNVHDDNSVNPIAPRIISATIAIKL